MIYSAKEKGVKAFCCQTECSFNMVFYARIELF